MRTMARILVLVLSLAALAAAALPRKNLTVAEALSPGAFGGNQPKAVKWMPDGKAFAYFDPAPRGQHSDLMVCDAATLARKPLLTQAAFRAAYGNIAGVKGDELAKASFGSYSFSPKGRFLLLDGPDGFYLWDLQAAALKHLTAEADEADVLTFSPDEGRLAYTAKGNLNVLDLKSGSKTLLAEGKAPLVTCGEVDWLYGEELDLDRAFWWSPDGKSIAYLRFDETGVYRDPMVDESRIHPEVKEQFYPRPGDALPKVTLHVVPACGGPSVAVAGAGSGEGYLPRATWLPDSSGLLYALYNRAQDQLAFFRSDLSGGAPRKVLEEKSATWVNVPEAPPRFLPDGRFLWLSERDGYKHVYLCGLDGKAPLQLTRGPWVVDGILGVDEAKGWVYVDGNRDGVLGCQVFRTDLKGKNLERISSAAGWHAATFSPDATRYLDSASDISTPDVLSLFSARDGKGRVVAPNPAPELAEYGFVKPEFVTVRTSDGVVLQGSVVKPRDFDPSRKYPAIVEVYGGPHMQMVQDKWNSRWAPINQLFAQNGFVAFSVDNRGSDRRGKAFENVLLRRMGKAELEDQLAGAKALETMPFVDAARVGLWGWSYGGYMTTYALTHTDAYRCGFAVAPVTDWLDYDACYTERYLKLPKDNPEGYNDSSPLFSAEGLRGPFFLAQGLMDDNVHFSNSARMADAFYKARKPFGMAYYPRMDHGIREKEPRADLFTRMLGFFRENLQGQK